MEYAQAKNAYPSTPPMPAKVADKPRLHAQIDHLDKLLAAGHSLAGAFEQAADRIVGPVPQDPGKDSVARPVSSSVEQKLAEVIAAMEALCRRLEGTLHRIDSAV